MRLRLFIIRLLVGKRTIIINAHIKGKVIIEHDKGSYIENCTFKGVEQ